MSKVDDLKFLLNDIEKAFEKKPDIALLKLDKAYKLIMEQLKKVNSSSV